MEYGAHLPLIDFDGDGWRPGTLASYARTAQHLGFVSITTNDHLVFARPWLDGIVSLASVVDAASDIQLATTIALPVVRGPAALAKSIAALDILSGGRLAVGVGPGSSERDYEAAGVRFDERWPRFSESIRVLRAHLRANAPPFAGRFYSSVPALAPAPSQPDGPPIWIGSWGSDAGLRRVARYGDGWLASAYNATPPEIESGRERLAAELAQSGRTMAGFPCLLATMWMYVTDDPRARQDHLERLATMLNRAPHPLAQQVLIGPAPQCAATLRAYSEAGVDRVFVWPLADAEQQLELFMHRVAPLV